MNISDKDIANRLGMEPEEVTRLLAHGNKKQRNQGATFSQAWTPAPKDTP
jgi:DNA-directed RNA polymerase specialized sigma subunit